MNVLVFENLDKKKISMNKGGSEEMLMDRFIYNFVQLERLLFN